MLYVTTFSTTETRGVVGANITTRMIWHCPLRAWTDSNLREGIKWWGGVSPNVLVPQVLHEREHEAIMIPLVRPVYDTTFRSDEMSKRKRFMIIMFPILHRSSLVNLFRHVNRLHVPWSLGLPNREPFTCSTTRSEEHSVIDIRGPCSALLHPQKCSSATIPS